MQGEDRNLERLKSCPRFDWCSVPVCPLDEKRGQALRLPDEPVCSLPKPLRVKLGSDLPWKGLSPKEFAGLKSWEKKDPNLRFETIKNLVVLGEENRFASRSQK